MGIRIIFFVCLLTSVSFTISAAQVEVKTLMDFDAGNGKDFEGWFYSPDITGFGGEGWRLGNSLGLGDGEAYSWGQGPRTFNKGDYGRENTAIIDTTVHAPGSNPLGGSFKVYETDLSIDDSDNRSTWWVWYDGKPLSERGITTANTNRMSFYLFVDGLTEIGVGGKDDSVPINFHIGTYLCWYGIGPAYGTGDGCPYEGVGNQHYYHYLSLNGGAWIHVLLDQHPTHKRGLSGSLSVANNPALLSEGKNYFEHMNQYYMEIRYDQLVKTAYWLDEIEYYFEDQNENEDSITSLWVGYWPENDYFEIGFQDPSFASYNGTTYSTFEIRWSNQPITNENYMDAAKIKPLFYSGNDYSGDKFLLRRVNSYAKMVWTRFEAPTDTSLLSDIYFAVKDVSVLGANAGLSFPYNRADGHNAPTDNIKTINFRLSSKPNAPSNLIITD